MDKGADFAFNLELDEALADFLNDGGASSSAADDDVSGAELSQLLQNGNLSIYEQKLLDPYEAETAARRTRLDLRRQVHDRAFTSQVTHIPEREWKITGANFDGPYGEGSSSSSSNGKEYDYVVYVKGLVEQMAAGIGVAICDCDGGLVFEVSTGLSGNGLQVNRELVAVKALVEGLDAAIMLGSKKIEIVYDNIFLQLIIAGKIVPKRENTAALVDRMNLLLKKFDHYHSSLVPQNDLKLASELARKAMASQVNQIASNSKGKSTSETCAICLEVTSVDQMFQITDCLHSYCILCMSKHVEVKLLQGILPKCPSENCRSEIKLDSCKKLLTPKLLEIMSERMKETCIPADKRIYCPYPGCSSLLSKTDFQGCAVNPWGIIKQLAAVTCPNCHGKFCINCKVPWHEGMTCYAYKSMDLVALREEMELKILAAEKHWRECPNCNHMVSLVGGCYHITCRCGQQFCYACGAKWISKQKTCNCPHSEIDVIHGQIRFRFMNEPNYLQDSTPNSAGSLYTFYNTRQFFMD